MTFQHDCHHQLALKERIHNALPFCFPAALYRKPPLLCSTGDQRMVGTASTAPVTVFIGPTCHLNGIDRLVGQRRYHHCHTGRPAAVGADVVGAVGLARVPLVQLIIVDHLRRAIRETNVAQRYKAGGLGGQQALHHTIAQEYAQVLGVVFRQSLLFIRQSEYLILKIGLSVVDDGIDLPYLCYFRFRHRDLAGETPPCS